MYVSFMDPLVCHMLCFQEDHTVASPQYLVTSHFDPLGQETLQLVSGNDYNVTNIIKSR